MAANALDLLSTSPVPSSPVRAQQPGGVDLGDGLLGLLPPLEAWWEVELWPVAYMLASGPPALQMHSATGTVTISKLCSVVRYLCRPQRH